MATLRVIIGGREVRRHELRGAAVVGRGEECDVAVIDSQISRRHCRFEPTPQGWIVVDLGSTNGTILDGRRVTDRALRDGELVRAGGVTLQFVDAKPRTRTLDDEVLEMLNDVAPSPSPQLDVAAAKASDESESSPRNETCAPAAAATAALEVVPGRGSRGAAAPSLWAMATSPGPQADRPATRQSARSSSKISVAPPSIGASIKKWAGGARAARGPAAADDAPWYRLRVPLPIGIAAALLFGTVLWFCINHDGRPSATSQPLVHHHHSHLDD